MLEPKIAPTEEGGLEPKFAAPRPVGSFYYRPGYKLFQVLFRAEVGRETMGALSRLLSNGRVHLLQVSAVREEGDGMMWNAVVECRSGEVTAEFLDSVFGSGEGLKGFKVVEGDGMLVDTSRFPLELASGQRVVIMSADVVQSMVQRMRDMFGTGGNVIVFEEGVAAGRSDARNFRQLLGENITTYFGQLMNLYTAAGYGIGELVRFDIESRAGVVRLREHIECMGRKSANPHSQWMRGHMAGSATEIFGTTVECLETRCLACGDPYCEFELRPADAEP